MGPTASGKSALAMNLAERVNGVIINADAMQMYRDLCILTARPTEEEEAQIPHRLYGVLAATDTSTVALWLQLVVPEIRAVWAAGQQPILVGGTGMYIKALMEGLAEIPAIPAEIRAEARRLGIAALADYDPLMHARLKPGDTQRRLRALEVVLATGKSLAEWQEMPPTLPLPEATFQVYKVDRSREEIYARIDQRFAEMAGNGAIEEVSKLQIPNLQTSNYPLFRAHGVPEILKYLAGEMTLEAAISQAQQNTRNYAKRQMTWLRNQLPQAKAVLSVDDILDHPTENL